MTRIAAIPFISHMILTGGDVGLRVALVLGAIVGATDFVDGYLARKYGGTPLGAFLDPLADKLFLVAILVPFAVRGFMPAWLVGLILAREFLVTGLRIMAAQTDVQFVTSRLGKLKTILQQGGCAFVYVALKWSTGAVVTFHVAGIIALILIMTILVAVRNMRWPFWLPWALVGWFSALMAHVSGGPEASIYFITAVIAFITWLSGLNYFRALPSIYRKLSHGRGFYFLILLLSVLVAFVPHLIGEPASAASYAIGMSCVLWLAAFFVFLALSHVVIVSGSTSTSQPKSIRNLLYVAAVIGAISCVTVLSKDHSLAVLALTIGGSIICVAPFVASEREAIQRALRQEVVSGGTTDD